MAAVEISQPADRVTILGVPINRMDMATTLKTLSEFIDSGRPHVVVTADSSGIVAAQSDREFFTILCEADLVTPDSTGILWAARRQGQPMPERVSGVDLVEAMCALSAKKGFSIFFLGASHDTAQTAAEKLRKKYPGCNIIGARHGYFREDEDETVAREIANLKPDVLFVGMGIPRQEKFIFRTREVIRAKVAMGVGGSFDVHSGKAKRAPKWVQKISMEWLWRLLWNPRKFSKAKALPRFVWLVLRSGK